MGENLDYIARKWRENTIICSFPSLIWKYFLLSYSNYADIDWARGSKLHGRENDLRIWSQYPFLGDYLRMRLHIPKTRVIASMAR